MGQRLSFDTSFLIDIQREQRDRRREQRAHGFLRRHRGAVMLVSAVALGEFAEGFEDPRKDRQFLTLAAAVEILAIDRETSLVYGAQVRSLRLRGRLIGANDLWIAAAALRYDVSLVTGDSSHFKRIEGLRLIEY